MELNIIDGVIGVIILGSGVLGLWRGLIKEVLSLITWIAAIFTSIHYSTLAYNCLKPYIANEAVLVGVAFASIFFATLLVGAVIIFVINKILSLSGLGPINRLMGAIFGVGRGVLMIVVAIMVMQSTSLANDLWWKNSQLVPKFKPLVDYAQRNTKEYRLAAATLVYSNIA